MLSENGADDNLRPLNEVIRDIVPGKRNPSTEWRWTNKGIAGLKLPVWYVGRAPHTTKAAVRAWLEAVTAARLARTARTKQGAADVTSDELEAVGLTLNQQ
jgi:hypothetical protein